MVGSLVASWALSMLAAGKRENGRWAYGAQSPESGKSWANMVSQLGTIADHARHLLLEVRADSTTLNAAYEQACEARRRQMGVRGGRRFQPEPFTRTRTGRTVAELA